VGFIQNIYTQAAPYAYEQSVADAFTEANMDLSERRMSLFFRALKKRSGISTRHSCLPTTYFAPNSPLGNLSTGQRQELYSSSAKDLIAEVCKQVKALPKIDNLITVSCTGYQTPGLDFVLSDELELETPFRYNIGAMGCYAGITALRLANQLPGTTLLLCLELCSLHFQNEPANFSTITSNSLFADGAALVHVTAQTQSKLKLLSFHSARIPGTLGKMSWHLKDKGFLMHLDSQVPELIGTHIEASILSWLTQNSLDLADIKHWVVHPGGLSVLQAVQASLKLSTEQLQDSLKVFQDYGNMSSGTVFFILQSLINAGLKTGDKIIMLAFGPGLTAEMALLEVN
jgi:predicted naringenin-chalcone synthase